MEVKDLVWSVLLILVIEVPSGYFINFIPASRFTFRGLFKEYSFEQKLYKFLGVKQWKKYLPEGAKVMKNAFDKQHLNKKDQVYYLRFTQELCRAEALHWFHLIVVILVFLPFEVRYYMIIYAILSNIPCIVAQRYNRPRMIQIMNRLKERK